MRRIQSELSHLSWHFRRPEHLDPAECRCSTGFSGLGVANSGERTASIRKLPRVSEIPANKAGTGAGVQAATSTPVVQNADDVGSVKLSKPPTSYPNRLVSRGVVDRDHRLKPAIFGSGVTK